MLTLTLTFFISISISLFTPHSTHPNQIQDLDSSLLGDLNLAHNPNFDPKLKIEIDTGYGFRYNNSSRHHPVHPSMLVVWIPDAKDQMSYVWLCGWVATYGTLLSAPRDRGESVKDEWMGQRN